MLGNEKSRLLIEHQIDNMTPNHGYRVRVRIPIGGGEGTPLLTAFISVLIMQLVRLGQSYSPSNKLIWIILD